MLSSLQTEKARVMNSKSGNNIMANYRAPFDNRNHLPPSIPFSMGGIEVTGDTNIPETPTEDTRAGDVASGDVAASPALQSAGDEVVFGDADVKEPNVNPADPNNARGLQAGSNESNPESLVMLVQQLLSGHLYHVNGRFFTYRNGRWVQIGKKNELLPAIARHYGYTKKIRELNEIVEQLKLRYAVAAFQPPQPNLICLNNGTLNPLMGQLHAHSPEFYLRHKVDITWDANATCPRWERFLDEIFRDDIDKAQKIRLVQQWFGYCLIPWTDMQKMLMLIGEGENGKSVLLKILTHIVGRENTSNIQVERFGRSEVRAELEGKLLNISPELSDRAWQHSEYLKAIVVGDEIEVRRLYQDSFSFKPTARIVVSTNNLPRVYDHSHGFFRRVMMVPFNRKFTDADRNRQLEAALMAELPGILAWAVRGLQELVQDGEFVIPASSEAAKVRYMVESDDARLFFDEQLIQDPTGAGMPVPVVYSNYCKWCSESGLSAMNKFTFGKRLRVAGVGQRHTRTGDVWLVRAKGEHGAVAQAQEPVTAGEVFMAT